MHSKEINDTESDKKYIKLFVAGFIVFSSLVFVFKRADLFLWIGNCSSLGFEENTFMAYCHDRRYGDYEHLAFWHQLEPGLTEKVRKADVVFLGNSRTQYAFSTKAVTDYFSKEKLNHYVFGFGKGSQNYTPEEMAKKFSISPSVLIINADPFFTDHISQTNKNMLDLSNSGIWEYRSKGWLQDLQRTECANREGRNNLVHSILCEGREETLFRNRLNGHWNVKYFRKQKAIPVALDSETKDNQDEIAKSIAIAERFFRTLKINKECVILTVTPRTATPMRFARTLSEKLQVKGIFPYSSDLRTLDDSHLNPESAEWWSAKVLDIATPLIKKCTSASL